MIDGDSKEYLRRMLEANAPPFNELTPQDARRVTRLIDNMFRWDPKAEVKVWDTAISSPSSRVPVRVFTPMDRENANRPVLITFHGGGWVVGSHTDPDINSTCISIANAARCVVVSVGYRLAPENKFPAAVEDAYAALTRVAGNPCEFGIDSSRIAVGGVSAGGNIAAVLCLMARDRNGPAIVLQMLVYPVTDHSFETESYRTFGEEYGLTTEEMKWFWSHYLANPEDGKNPYASPLRALDLSHLPPAFVMTAENDPLRDEGEAYGGRLKEAGVPTKIVRYGGAIHGFFTLPFGENGRADAASELRKVFRTA